jgi:4-hydroxy-2-oxoheptanedioate aldolase
MPDQSMPRLNPLLDLLEADKPLFTFWVNYYGVGSDYQTAAAAQANPHYDFLLYDLEHQPYDVGQLRRFLWDLIDPATLESQGRRGIKPVIVRLPASGRERNEWMVKQVLDAGVAGLMFPHIEAPEEALHAVAAARYPQKPGVADYLPEGRRGTSPAVPARYWGLEQAAYVQRSDIWGLDPDGNLLLIFIIETYRAVENVRSIAKALSDAGVKAMLWAGGGDLSLSYGERWYGGRDMPQTIVGLDAILAAGKEFGFPVGMNDFGHVEADYHKGARGFFALGPAALAGPPVSDEVRRAVGR